MILLKSYILNIQAFVLAIFVAMLSMGFTYHWEVCLHADEISDCKELEVETSCCCVLPAVTMQCCSVEMSDTTCDLSFSKYIQFDFEVLTSAFEDLVSDVDFEFATNLFLTQEEPYIYSQVSIADYSLPPPKTGREILCITQTFLI